MQIGMHVINEIRKNSEPPDIKFFKLEYELFNSIYKVCPSNYNSFKSRFKQDYILSYIIDKKELIGFSFLDILINDSLYYLRVLAISEEYRNKGYATTLLKSVFNYIKNKEFVLAFVTDNSIVTSIISKFNTTQLSKQEIPPITKQVSKYNKKLLDQEPNSWVNKYYELANNTYSNGYFFLKKINNETN